MKKINIFCILSLLFFMSCDSILDKNPLDTFTNSNFWTTEGNIEGYANAFYLRFTGYGNSGGTGDFYFKTLTDDQAGHSFTNWNYIQIPATDTNWQNGWIEIRRANILLENVPQVEALEEEARNHWTGVARLMRAWEYYKLVRRFGDVPWIDKSLDITDEGYLYSHRQDRDEIMDKVLEDLNYACDNIRDNGSQISFSQDMAYAMKAEICLYEGTFRKYRTATDKQKAPDLTGAKTFLEEAKCAAAAIMAKEYSLNEDYQTKYNSESLSGNSEVIFYKAYKQDIFSHSLIAYLSSSTPMDGITKNAFDSYLFLDGKPKSLTSYDDTDLPVMETREDGNEYYSITHLLAVRDKRLSGTIDDAVSHSERTIGRYEGDILNYASTGYGIKKYDNPDIPQGYRNTTVKNYTDAPLFWLSIIYLQYAEAAAELESVGGEAMTQSDLDKTINLLRDRAGLPHLTKDVGFSDPANNHGVSDLIWEIRRERRCELIMDNDIRYWDLIRWHQLDKLDSTSYPEVLLGANFSTDPTIDPANLVNGYVSAFYGNTRTFDVKYYLDPIPSGQILLNAAIGQNEGW
ncbi:MAG: RagB/SusD family nutrient uptake outer membrane protein [Bacteroides sp.]|nr:RagB/SusD family nutrient uptake outer membrane protein [Bacteroides sp.]